MKAISGFVAAGLLLAVNANAGPRVGPNDAYVRIIDTGQGHASVAKIPGGGYMVFDTGNFLSAGRNAAFNGVKEVVGRSPAIDLVVLSHSDADHLGATEEILQRYKAKTIIRGGLERTTKTWKRADKAVKAQRRNGAKVYNLKRNRLAPGTNFRVGDATVTFIVGHYAPPRSWGFRATGSEFRNAGSIVVRLSYKGGSVLFTGDAVGRHIGDPLNAHIATEKAMVDNISRAPIKSDVLIAPHHGADNGSSLKFLKAVAPKFVVFAAGSQKYQHPRRSTAERVLRVVSSKARIFRTDRGDDEGPKEWNYKRVSGCVDQTGDDDIEIVLRANGKVDVGYRNPGTC